MVYVYLHILYLLHSISIMMNVLTLIAGTEVYMGEAGQDMYIDTIGNIQIHVFKEIIITSL